MLRTGVVKRGGRFLRVLPALVGEGSCGQRRQLCGRALRPFEREWDDVHRQMRRAEAEMERAMDRLFGQPASVISRWRPWWSVWPGEAARTIPVEYGADGGAAKFRVRVDVSGFPAEGIRVRVKDGVVEVKAAAAEDVAGGGKVSREANWAYELPKDVEEESLQSFFNSDGILMLEAQRKLPKEKEIPVQQQQKVEKVAESETK